jgi:hypothetical protein
MIPDFYEGNLPLHEVVFNSHRHAFAFIEDAQMPIGCMINGTFVRICLATELNKKDNQTFCSKSMKYVGVIDRVYYENIDTAYMAANTFGGKVIHSDMTLKDIKND